MLSFLQLLNNFIRLSPLRQFWLNILIPVCGIIFFGWLPAAILFYFIIEMANYWLCNLVLMLWFATAPSPMVRRKSAATFTIWFWAALFGFYWFTRFMSDPKADGMTTNITIAQVIAVVLIYWVQFVFYLYKTKPKGKMTQERIIKDVSYRMTAIYMVLFCVIAYVFAFWSQTAVVSYALAVVLVFAKSLADLVLIAIRYSQQQAVK